MFRSFLGTAVMAMIAVPAMSDSNTPALGRSATPEDIQRIDIDIMPDGRGLPEGVGRVASGAATYAEKCATCHGADGHGGPNGSLAGEPLHSPQEFAADRSLKKTVGNYWPHATTVFDYVRRTMPYDRPGSLTDGEVYDLTAYILHLNGLIDADETIDRESLPKVVMPARRYFQSMSSAGGAQ